MDLDVTVKAKIQKPVSEVFDAVYNPEKLSAYFTTGGASGPLDAGTTVTWDFADYPGAFPVRVVESQKDSIISLEWSAHEGDYNTAVLMKFEPLGPNETQFSVTEAGWRDSSAGIKNALMNSQGWMNMSCCLKAWLEYGINLRQGFF